MQKVVIRHYRRDDRPFVRNIAWNTAFLGDSAGVFFDNKEILSDFLTLYFTDYEPESSFVAEIDVRVIGYLIGARNIDVLNRIFFVRILPRLVTKAVVRGVFFSKKNILFMTNALRSFLKGEFRVPYFLKYYPALLHINIEKKFRALGIGALLIEAYLNYLNKAGIEGLHLATVSDVAVGFFKKQGFNLLYKHKRSLLGNILGKEYFCYLYGKKILTQSKPEEASCNDKET